MYSKVGLERSSRVPYRWIVIILPMLAGCLGGQTGEETDAVKCKEDTSIVAANRSNLVGVVPQEVFENLATSRIYLLTWNHNLSANEEIEVLIYNPSDRATLFTRTPEGEADNDNCRSYVTMEVELGLFTVTSDRFSENIVSTLSIYSREKASLEGSTPLSEINGTYDGSEMDEGFRQHGSVHVRIDFSEETVVGQIDLVPVAADRTPAVIAYWP